jgi:hypothetical protein
MTTNYHTAISVGAAANAATFNTPLGQLDAVLGTLNDTVTNAVTGVYNVLEYGAVGDGSTDDTAAIQAAINACDDTGGEVYFPVGIYSINATLTISTKRGVRLSGAMQSYANPGAGLGTTLKWAGSASDDMLYIFNSQDIRIDGMCFDGADTAGSRAIFVDSDNVQVSKRIQIDHCFFRRFSIGIQFGSSSSGTQYQVDSDWITNTAFAEMYGSGSTCIHIQSQNVSYLNIENCELQTADYGLRLIRSGPIRMCNVSGGGQAAMKFISVEGPTHTLNITDCQAETIAYWLHVTSSAPASLYPFMILQCTIDGPIQIDARTRIISIGSVYNADVTLAANDCEWASIFDYWTTGNEITKSGINCRAYYLDGSLGLNLDGNYILRHLSATKTWDPGSVADGDFTSTNITVTGAVVGDTCTVSMTTLNEVGALLFAHIACSGTAVVTLMNHTGGALDLAEGTLRVDVWKH